MYVACQNVLMPRNWQRALSDSRDAMCAAFVMIQLFWAMTMIHKGSFCVSERVLCSFVCSFSCECEDRKDGREWVMIDKHSLVCGASMVAGGHRRPFELEPFDGGRLPSRYSVYLLY